MTPLQRLARRFGYDLTLRKKARPHEAQLATVLQRFEISCVLDVGANVGQYASMLREWGFAGRIVSFEPLSEAHATLAKRAGGDSAWQVAPRMAIGDHEGEVDLQVSAESDMSSILSQTELLQRVSPSSEVLRREQVPIVRLEDAAAPYVQAGDRVFLKIDTQGFEPQVLAGVGSLLPRLSGLQLEMSIVTCYEGEVDYREMIDRLATQGFRPYLFIPGYFERKLGRQLQLDGVFMREAGPSE
ncbi:MAG: FkbM family methyltransferase [Pseudomonadota bacterium]